jgi:hypothetical protein
MPNEKLINNPADSRNAHESRRKKDKINKREHLLYTIKAINPILHANKKQIKPKQNLKCKETIKTGFKKLIKWRMQPLPSFEINFQTFCKIFFFSKFLSKQRIESH